MKWVLILLFVTVATSERTFVDIAKYENVTIVDTESICAYFESANVSEPCWEQLEIVCANSSLLMTIFDASAKFPYPGLTYSTRRDYGNYDQCLSVDHSYSNGRVLGEYCTFGLIIPDIFGNVSDYSSIYTLAVCRPNACSASDYNIIVRYLLSLSEDVQGFFQDGSCVTVESNPITTGDIIVLSVFGITIVFMIISTTYDLYLYLSGRKSYSTLCLAFSVLSNGRKLLHISRHSTSKEHIETFHGIRVISMMWIVAGHGMAAWTYAAVTDFQTVDTWTSNFSSFYMTAAPLSVDTFFFMSGFLLAFNYYKGKTKSFKRQALSVPNMIVHRYLRLTPAMLMIYLVTITFFVHLGSGPLWTLTAETFSSTCKTYWWRFFLYIQNYYDFGEICLLQTWYLSADMQMFIIAPLVFIPVSLQLNKYGFKNTIVGLFILNIFWTMLPMIIKLVFREYQNEYDTHSRLIDYFIGAMLGLFMRVKIDKPFLYKVNENSKPIINLVTWCVTIFGMLAILMCYQDQQVNHGYESWTVFESLMRPAWCIGLSWITYSCYHGHGGFANWILCRPIFQILGRLTYCIYLVHITVIMYYMATARTKWHFNEYNSFYQFCGHYLVSVIVAIFWTLAFESPLITIEKYFLGGSRPAKEDKLQKNSSVEEFPKYVRKNMDFISA